LVVVRLPPPAILHARAGRWASSTNAKITPNHRHRRITAISALAACDSPLTPTSLPSTFASASASSGGSLLGSSTFDEQLDLGIYR
jgi:hypothetical protein